MGFPKKVLSQHLQVSLSPKIAVGVNLVHNRRARRYLLKVGRDGQPRLTIPNRGTKGEAMNFLMRNITWLKGALQDWDVRRMRAQPEWGEGSTLFFRGREVALKVRSSADKNSVWLSFGAEVIGPVIKGESYRNAVLKHLRFLAEKELPNRTQELADHFGVKISRITIRAQRTRWGSCSAKGSISLNWHLIQTPPFVVDYIIIHELMHRKQMNHSAKYWAEVERACPGYLRAEKWLKESRLDLTV
jgi:predicted metal-dependent hydrolase